MPVWESVDWYQHALLRLYVGDQEGYRDACRQMLELFGDSDSNQTTIETVRACVLAPGAPCDPVELTRRAQHVADVDKAAGSFYVAGMAHYRAGQYRQAAERLKTASTVDLSWEFRAIAYPGLAMAYHRLGDVDRAQEALANAEEFFERGAGNLPQIPLDALPEPWFDAVEFMQLRNEAWRLLKGSAPPDDSRIQAHRVRALAALADVDTQPLRDSARAHARKGEWAAAAVDYGRLLDLLSGSLLPISQGSRIGDEVAAKPNLFAELVKNHPADARLWVAHGRVLARQKKWDLALEAYDRVMTSLPPDTSAMLEYACLLLLTGDTAGYRRLCAKLVERYGNTTDFDEAHNLSRVCTLAEGAVADPARPVAWAEPPSERRPVPWFSHAVGAAQYRAGQFDEAVRAFRKSQALAPTWPGQCMNDAFLILAHARLGQSDDARRFLEKTDRWLADADRDLAAEQVGFPRRIFPADWLIVQVLRREAARALANQTKSTEPTAMGPLQR
jgi:tetratricopeptide (TPR) repeat protein